MDFEIISKVNECLNCGQNISEKKELLKFKEDLLEFQNKRKIKDFI